MGESGCVNSQRRSNEDEDGKQLMVPTEVCVSAFDDPDGLWIRIMDEGRRSGNATASLLTRNVC